MIDYITPFTRAVNLQDGTIPDAVNTMERRLSDLKGLFTDTDAEAALLYENPLIYHVYEATHQPKVPGQLMYGTTVIYPGKVGDEYFMTKGHFHGLRDRAEIYYGLTGEGLLLMMTPEGAINTQVMYPGAGCYVPPHWAHRTINTGSHPFSFLAVWPADAGYDYGTIAERGFASIVVERDGKPAVVPNPRYQK
jgi:glucose-6-phosphate isomerase